MEKETLLNTHINNVDMEEAVRLITQMIYRHKKGYVVPINVDVVVKIEQDAYLKKIVDSADIAFVDGKPLVWISQFYRQPVKAKISGSDLVPLLCREAAKSGFSLFFLGGKEGVALQAKQHLEKQYPGINISGTYAPPLGFEKDIAEINKINNMISSIHPDLLIVCLGCPKQEKWIYENYQKYNAIVSICAGATIDFLAGNVRRAPVWMSEHGLEWLYRFCQEPARLFKRYFVDDIQIFKLIWKYKKTAV